jgi:hypothetical protein
MPFPLRALLQKILKHRHRSRRQLFVLFRERIPQSRLTSYPSSCYPPPDTRITSHTAMGREEQTEEREVLDSIFPEEITGSFVVFLCIPQRNQSR